MAPNECGDQVAAPLGNRVLETHLTRSNGRVKLLPSSSPGLEPTTGTTLSGKIGYVFACPELTAQFN